MKSFIDSHLKSIPWTELFVVFGGAALLCATSQIEIPLQPVPVTLQTVAVMLIGLTYSPRRAVEAISLWIALAAAGMPVLAEFSGGISKLIGPTGGYIVGFIPAVYLMTTLKQKFALNSWQSDALLTLLGTLIIFITGVTWLSHLIGGTNAFYYGVLPFVLPGFVKGGLLCTALQILRHARRA